MSQLVHDVTAVALNTTLTVGESAPALIVEAEGHVNTGGWHGFALVQQGGPVGGLLNFDFVADPPKPGTIVTEGFVRVTAHVTLANPGGVDRVRVRAATNQMDSNQI